MNGSTRAVLAAARELGKASPAEAGLHERQAGGFYLSLRRQYKERVLVIGRTDRRPSYEEAFAIAREAGAPEGSDPRVGQQWLASATDLPARKVLTLEFAWREVAL